MALWFKSVTVQYIVHELEQDYKISQNFAIYCHVEHLHFGFEGFFTAYSSSQESVDNFKSVCCPSERAVRLIERRITIK